jgi:hypothetical protein
MRSFHVGENRFDSNRIAALVAQVDHKLWTANYDRRKVMSRETLASLLNVIIDGKELAWARSDSTNSCYGSGHPATFALCARTGPDELSLAIASGPGKNGSPGRAWPPLKPWRPSTCKTRESLSRWLNEDNPELVRLSLLEAACIAKQLTTLPPAKTRWHHLETDGNAIVIVPPRVRGKGT